MTKPCVRALLRIVLLRITRRPLVSPPIPEREFDPENLPAGSDTSSPTLAPSSPPSSLPSTPDHLKNNHIPLPPHPLLTPPPPAHSPIPVEEFLLPKALTTASVKAPTSLVKPLASPKEWLSEVIYHIRPLVYGVCSIPSRIHNLKLILLCSYHVVLRPERQQTADDSACHGASRAQSPPCSYPILRSRAFRIRSQRPRHSLVLVERVHLGYLD